MLARRRAKLLVPGPEASKEMIDDARDQIEVGGELSESEIEAILSLEPISQEERNTELALLEPVLELGRGLVKDMPIDSKGRYILDNIEEWIKGQQRCLIFTGFLETVDYLCEILEKYVPLEITSRVTLDERKRTVKKLTRGETRIIIGTDAMSESLNLQAASVEINYEVPWSPVSYIQRVGRIWRLGQKTKQLFIHNFLPAFKVERRVLEVVLEKVRTINDEFGEIGLSVFTRELGSVEDMVKREQKGEDISQHVEEALRKTRYVSEKVLDVLNESMTLPRVVNLEELQKEAHIFFEDTFTEKDLLQFLEYLKDSGYASGNLPSSESEQSTYFVNSDGEYIPVVIPSLHDSGVKSAINVAKSIIERTSHVMFSYHKSMSGEVILIRVEVDGVAMFEEPVLITPDGLLTYGGITSLVPPFVETQTNVTFISLDEYKEKRESEWLNRRLALWESKKNDLQLQIIETEDAIKKELKRQEFIEHEKTKPQDVRVVQAAELCAVDFLKTESEQSYRTRHEVEMLAMEAASDYYSAQGYTVRDVARQNVGYDILCKKQNEVLRVEVKGIEGASHPTLTENERRTAMEFADGFILFVLELRDDGDRMYAIPDPTVNISMTPHEKTVYAVTGYSSFEIKK
jgi:SNF2 family DNA or RNA helicase